MTGPKLAFHSALLLACGVQVALSQNLDPLLPWRDFINAVDIPEFWPIDINLPSVGNIPGFEIGACRNPPTVPEFNVTAFLGDWYAQRQTASSFQPEGQTCVRAQYGARSETTITVYNTGNQGRNSIALPKILLSFETCLNFWHPY